MTSQVIKHFNNYADFYNVKDLVKLKPFIRDQILSLCHKYNINDFRLVFQYNDRLRSTLGRINIKYNNKNLCWIELNPQFVLGCRYDWNNGGQQALISVTKHETIHFILYHRGQAYRDGDRSFEQMLAENGASSSGTTKSYRRVSLVENVGYKYDKCANTLTKITSEYHQEAQAEAKIGHATGQQKAARLAQLQAQLRQAVAVDLAALQSADNQPKIKFSNRLRNSFARLNWYGSDLESISISNHNLLILDCEGELDEAIHTLVAKLHTLH